MVIDEAKLKEFASILPKHLDLRVDHWRLSMWKEDEVHFNARRIGSEVDKFLMTKEVLPIKIFETNNVITLIGMRESIDRDINVSSTDLNWNSIGTSSTAELESQTDLVAEDSGGSYARKVFSTGGTRQRVNQTMKMAMMWDDGDISATPLAIKESGIHWHLSDPAKCHARVVATTFTLDAGDIFVVQINELHANGTL